MPGSSKMPMRLLARNSENFVLINTPLKRGDQTSPSIITASAVSAVVDKPLKQFETRRAESTPLKRGVNDRAAGGFIDQARLGQ
jgi:hypothetical protein